MIEPVCELAQVSKTYRDGRAAHVTAVRELSLRVHAGELVALWGRAGVESRPSWPSPAESKSPTQESCGSTAASCDAEPRSV